MGGKGVRSLVAVGDDAMKNCDELSLGMVLLLVCVVECPCLGGCEVEKVACLS